MLPSGEHSDPSRDSAERGPAEVSDLGGRRGALLRRWGGRPGWRRASAPFWLLAPLSFALILPLWSVPWPPLQDVPQHLATIRVLHSYGAPEYGFERYFSINLLRTQYLAYYLVCDLLAYIVDVRVANLLLLSAALLWLPFSIAQLLGALRRDRVWALLALPLTYNAHVILGFLNFVAALPLMFSGLSLAVRQNETWTRRRALLLAAVLALCFFTHVVPFAMLAAGVLVLGLHRSASRVLRLWAPLVPCAPLLLLWLWKSPAGQSTARAAGLAAGEVEMTFRSWSVASAQLPMWLTDVLGGDGDLWLLRLTGAAFCCALSVGFLLRDPSQVPPAIASSHRRLVTLPLLAAAFYLGSPSAYDWIWPIAERFALLALLLSIPLLPRLTGPPRWTAVAISSLLAVIHLSQVSTAFSAFAAEVGDVEGAIAAIPPRSRVAGLIFQRSSESVRFAPFLHYAALYQLRRGGVAMFSFADFPQSPIAFRPESRPPAVPPRWEWLPRQVFPRRDLMFYDYVLVRGGPGLIAHQTRAFAEVFRNGLWRVYRRNPDPVISPPHRQSRRPRVGHRPRR